MQIFLALVTALPLQPGSRRSVFMKCSPEKQEIPFCFEKGEKSSLYLRHNSLPESLFPAHARGKREKTIYRLFRKFPFSRKVLGVGICTHFFSSSSASEEATAMYTPITLPRIANSLSCFQVGSQGSFNTSRKPCEGEVPIAFLIKILVGEVSLFQICQFQNLHSGTVLHR